MIQPLRASLLIMGVNGIVAEITLLTELLVYRGTLYRFTILFLGKSLKNLLDKKENFATFN
jgi:hypothetical protein